MSPRLRRWRAALRALASVLPLALAALPAGAQSSAGDTDLAKKLQNPVADLISLPFQLNYDEAYGPRHAGRLTLNVQPVIPIAISEDWNLISRTILPVIYQGSLGRGVDSAFGLGDTLQSFFFSPKEPVGGWILGGGPVLLLPTATDDLLKSDQLGLGPTFVALRQEHGFTYGALVNHVWGVTGPTGERVSSTFIQPFLSYTWPTATTLTLNSESTYDWQTDDLTLPINLMLSQLVKLGSQPVNFQIGGRYYAEAPSGGPEWGVRFAVTLLFPK